MKAQAQDPTGPRAALSLIVLLALGLAIAGPPAGIAQSAGTTYYVDCAGGDDGNDGTSELSPWRTTTRANQETYGPGDRILFRRGAVCSGERLQPVGDGTVQDPIVIADYGSGDLAAIDGVGVHEPAILLQNVQNYVVRNLRLTQHGQTPQELDTNNEKGKDRDERSDEYMRAVLHVLGGPDPDLDCGEPCTVRNVTLESLEVHDGQWNGIYAAGGYYQVRTGLYGYIDNLTISNVESWGHHKSGIEVTSTYFKTNEVYAATNIQVLDSYLHHNGGDGVMMGPVGTGLIDGNECAYNGQIRNARLGCWGWDSRDLTIQFNESHHNRTPLTDSKARDGGGFDLDLGIENGMMQYNWSHDNEGEGFLLLTWPIGYGFSRGVTHNAQMRYNVGERDGKKLAGGITVFGGVDPAVIYNNVIYYEPDRPAGSDMFGAEGGAITSDTWGKSGSPNLHVYNNIFIVDGTVNPNAVSNLGWSNGHGAFFFDNNLWWRVEGGVRWDWGGVITSWSDWQAQGYDPNGLNADPQVAGPLGGGPLAYQLAAGSPAIDAGRDVTEALQGMGGRDYFANPTPQGVGYDVGIHEFPGGPPPEPGEMHVAAIDVAVVHTNGPWYRAEATATIVDAAGAPVAGATVLGSFTGSTADGVSGGTEAGGRVTLVSSKVKSGGSWTFCVDDVTKSGSVYDPAANLETCDGASGP